MPEVKITYAGGPATGVALWKATQGDMGVRGTLPLVKLHLEGWPDVKWVLTVSTAIQKWGEAAKMPQTGIMGFGKGEKTLRETMKTF